MKRVRCGVGRKMSLLLKLGTSAAVAKRDLHAFRHLQDHQDARKGIHVKD